MLGNIGTFLIFGCSYISTCEFKFIFDILFSFLFPIIFKLFGKSIFNHLIVVLHTWVFVTKYLVLPKFLPGVFVLSELIDILGDEARLVMFLINIHFVVVVIKLHFGHMNIVNVLSLHQLRLVLQGYMCIACQGCSFLMRIVRQLFVSVYAMDVVELLSVGQWLLVVMVVVMAVVMVVVVSTEIDLFI